MAASSDKPMFRALSYGDKWRVTRLVAKGEAPQDPRMAAAAVELAESCQSRGREVALHRGLAIVLILVGLALAILAAADGDALVMSAMGLIVLSNVAQFAFNPMTRPKNVARSLEASRRVSATGSWTRVPLLTHCDSEPTSASNARRLTRTYRRRSALSAFEARAPFFASSSATPFCSLEIRANLTPPFCTGPSALRPPP